MPEKRRIDPKIDCVFKAILGSEVNKNLLIHFLNAVLERAKGAEIIDVDIKNPYSEKDFIKDKLSIVDIKAVDTKGATYQIEIQIALHPAFKSRIIYTWSGIYHSLLKEGQHYNQLEPVISIWILGEALFTDTDDCHDIDDCHLTFSLYDKAHSLTLTDHLAIHILQLPKWNETVKTEKDRWLYLFQKGKDIDPKNPPETMKTKEMRQAMNVLNRFAENEEDYLLYLNRLEATLTMNTWQKMFKDFEETKKQLRREEEKSDRLEKEKKQAEEELKELHRLLKEKGITFQES